MRILLVEDERKVDSFIARTLRENAYAVDVADTGEKALELGRDVSYDAILLDVRLPGMSGIEVCRELRQRGVEAPVMMLTARTLVEQRVEGLDTGADGYLTKPFVLAEFLARVRALIRRGFHKGNARLRYWPLNGPSFFSVTEVRLPSTRIVESRLRVQIFCGTDGRPTLQSS